MRTLGYDRSYDEPWTGPEPLTRAQRDRLRTNAAQLQDAELVPPQPPGDWNDAAAVAEYRTAVKRYDALVAKDMAMDSAFGPWLD